MNFLDISLADMQRPLRLNFKNFFREGLIFGILLAKVLAFASNGFNCRKKLIKPKGASTSQ